MRILALAAAAAMLAASATAHADPVTERRDLMRERGQILRTLAPVAQGREAFDAATVLDALERLHANAERGTDLDALWPEGSEGGDSAPRIWEDREGYQAASDAFEAAVAAALAAAPQDVDTYRELFSPIGAGCGACHQDFRL